MDTRKIEFTPKNITYYILGFLVVGLGVNFLSRSDFGLGAWDTVTFNLNLLLNETITKGTTSAIISLSIMAFVVLYTRKWVLLFMLVPIGAVAVSIDFWDLLIFGIDYMPSEIAIRIVFFIIGVIILPLGLSLILASKFPAFVFDELTIVTMKIFKTKSITKARLGIEFFGIGIGTLFGFLAGVRFGFVSYGSILITFLIPPMIDFYVTKLGRFDYEEDQN